MRNRTKCFATQTYLMSSVLSLALLSCLPAPVLADDGENLDVLNEAIETRNSTYAEVLAGVWVPRLGGETSFNTGLGSAQLVLETELDLGDIEPIANIELTLSKGDYALHLSGFSFSTSSRSTFDAHPGGIGSQQFGSLSLSNGEPIRADFDFNSAAVELQFLAGGIQETDISDGHGVTLRIAPTFSTRWVQIEQSIATLADSEKVNAEWIAFLVGAAIQTDWTPDTDSPFIDHISIELAAALGLAVGGDGGFIWQVRSGIQFNITPQFGILFGYRLVEIDFESNDYSIDVGLQGLFLAGSIRF